DLLSLNYIFMPWISDTFRKNYLEGDDPRYGILRYSYENLFIMNMGYSFVMKSNKNFNNNALSQTNTWQLRCNIESAGNLLNLTKSLFNAKHNHNGYYELFGIAFSQYAKFDLDFVKSYPVNENSSLAFHVALGVALPYGNSKIIPYEKRYFAGGANSVRGWSVRELGPGSYKGTDGKIDFINQTGNVKLDLSLEYRTYLFWKFYGATFIDAGNIWNTRNNSQSGEQLKADKFLKEIAVAYGLGLRLNFDYFILRFDGGMKAINPSIPTGKGHYPIINPNFKRDFTFHFAVGLPF
ncbi:MAG: BamA/TamA family outer membrane protein, partial [Bacteroidaceae bacterium]|nr:BamA/TamA family outer membrane protein [Bacteroidaceae bacterium]